MYYLKKIFTVLIAVGCTTVLFSQTPFQGKVTLKLVTEKESDSGIVEVYYGKQKIKGVMRKNNPSFNGNEDILFDFSKGLMTSIYTISKTYRTDSLTSKPNEFTPYSSFTKTGKTTMRLNQPCSEYSVTIIEKIAGADSMHITFWYADSLAFPVQQEIVLYSQLFLFTNGTHIALGMNVNGDKHNRLFNLVPVAVEAFSPADSVFEIPGDYTEEKRLAIDSPAILNAPVADTAIEISTTPAAEIKKKTPAKPNKNKTAPKAAAIRRKE